jgi:hypothetical protein
MLTFPGMMATILQAKREEKEKSLACFTGDLLLEK